MPWPWQQVKIPPIERPLVYLASNTVSRSSLALALGYNPFRVELPFIQEGQVWMLNSATIFPKTSLLDGAGDINGYYAGIALQDPSGQGITVCEGPLWRTDVGVDETNINLPAFHLDYLSIVCHAVTANTDLVNYIVKFLRVQ